MKLLLTLLTLTALLNATAVMATTEDDSTRCPNIVQADQAHTPEALVDGDTSTDPTIVPPASVLTE